jgi:hypothetical protein
MTPAPAARRLSTLACAALAAGALGLSACGDDGAATAEGTTAASSTSAVTDAPRSPDGPCPAKVSSFVSALDSLRRQLAVGLSYEQYAASVDGLRKNYGKIPVGQLTLQCLAGQGTPAEQALNRYIDGVNVWGECLADVSCTTVTIEPVLQRKWRGASRFLSEAQ